MPWANTPFPDPTQPSVKPCSSPVPVYLPAWLMCLRINHIMYLISRVIRLFCKGGFRAVIKGGEGEEQGRWIIFWCHCVYIIICLPHTTCLLFGLNQSLCQSPRWTAWLSGARLNTNRKISRRRKSRLLINVHHVALWRYRIDGPCTPHVNRSLPINSCHYCGHCLWDYMFCWDLLQDIRGLH